MFIVWIITNLKKKENDDEKNVRVNKILAKVDGSFFETFFPFS